VNRVRTAVRSVSAALIALAVLAVCGPGQATGSPPAGRPPGTSGPPRGAESAAASEATGGPAAAYDCRLNLDTDAFTGADGTASEIGWEGNHQGVVTCLGGTFFVQDGMYRNFGFGVYDGAPTTWTDAEGYLPAQVTRFQTHSATVAITEFADQLVIAGDSYVAVYSRVAVRNSTDHSIKVNPQPSSGLIPLTSTADTVAPHGSVVHDYVVAVDRFGNDYPWPTRKSLTAAGGFGQHFAHMKAFWNRQLAQIAQISVPDTSLDDAYRSGFIDTEIARSGDDLNTGVNGYESEFSHDVIGILANLFTQGDFSDAHALLTEARHVVGSQGQYEDGTWAYAWPWAIYLMKTGDLSFVKANFDTEGPTGSTEPSIEDTAHAIATDRTGPGGIMGLTDDIDSNGYWTVDDFEALMGLAAYRYLAQRVGSASEVQWATTQYNALLTATNLTLTNTISQFHLDYLPCSMLEPNTANRCTNAEDANWAAPFQFGKWAWDAPLFGATVNGPGLTLIDATYDYGFGRLQGQLPPETFGGFPSDYYSTAYNAGYGSWGLASLHHRDQGILSYEFMIENDQSGPYSWWESSTAPSTTTPWMGRHPTAGQGSSPHAWGMSEANKVLLDSLVAEKSDGTVIVGRGVPTAWVHAGRSMVVKNFPTTGGERMGIRITSKGRSVTLTLSGTSPSGHVLFQLPSFVDNISRASAGKINRRTGTVTLAPGTRSVTVQLGGAPGG
jgi:hypothetical protein